MIRTSTRLFRSCTLLVLLATCYVTPVRAQTYEYVAVTEASQAKKTGAVRAGSLVWQCKSNRCSVKGPWPAPAVAACATLAKEVGRLQSYGRSGAALGPNEMGQCNKGIPAGGPAANAAASVDMQSARPGTTASFPTTSSSSSPAATVVKELAADTAAPVRRQGAIRLTSGTTWNCQGSRCTGTGKTRLIDCFELAREVGRIRSFVGPSGKLTGAELARCNGPLLRSFRISARSGEDDLRQGSKLSAIVREPGGMEIPFTVFTRLAGNAYDTATIQLDNRAQVLANRVSVDGLESITLFFRSGRGGLTDGPDNWDMVQIEIRADMLDLDGRTSSVTVYEQSGNRPIRKFSDGDSMRIGRDSMMSDLSAGARR